MEKTDKKYNTQNLVTFDKRTEEENKAIRSKGGKTRAQKARERKTIKDTILLVLNDPIAQDSDVTKLDAIVLKTITKLYKNPSMKDLKLLAEILGELKLPISTEGLTLNIVSSDKGKKNINRLLKGK